VALIPLLLVPLINVNAESNSNNPIKQSCLGLVTVIHSMLSQKLTTQDQNFTYNKLCVDVTGTLASQLNETAAHK